MVRNIKQCAVRIAIQSLLFFPFAVLFSLEHALSEPVAHLYSAQGRVHGQLFPDTQWKVLEKGNKFNPKDAVRTESESRAGVLFVDGVLVRLSENSELQFKDPAQTGGQHSLFVLAGAIYLFSREPKQFPVIETPVVSAAVRGTEVVVHVRDKQTIVSVLDGQVECSNSFGAVDLGPGEEAITVAGHAPVKRILVRPTDAVQWALYYPAVLDFSDYAEFLEGASQSERQGWELLRLGQGSSAEQFFRGATWRDAFARSVIAYQRGDVSQAFRELKTISEPRPGTVLLYESALALSLGQVERAEVKLRDVQKQTSSSRPSVRSRLEAAALSQQALVLLVKNRKDEANALVTKARDLSPDSASVALVRSYVEQAYFHLDKARQLLLEGIKKEPGSILLRARLAEIELGFGRVEEASQQAYKALKLAPRNAYALSVLGFIELLRHHSEEALNFFQRASAQESSSGLPHLGRGLARIHQGELAEGRQELQMAVHLEPTVSLYRSYLGKAFFEEEREGLALHEYQQAIALDPKDPTPYLYQAFAKLSTHRPIDALEDIQNSISLNDSRAVFRSRLLLDQDQAVRSAGLSQVYTKVGFPELARVEAIKAVNRDYSNYSAHLLLAASERSTPNTTQANIAENFIANLLVPLNFNSVQPNAEGQSSLNEYTALFDRPGHRTIFEGVGRSRDKSLLGGISQSGVSGPLGYSLSYRGSQTDGFRENDFSKDNIVNLFGQYEPTYQDNFISEFNFGHFNQGDTSFSFNPQETDPDFTFQEEEISGRVGYHHQFGPQAHFISHVAYNDTTLKLGDLMAQRVFRINAFLGDRSLGSLFDPRIVNEQSRQTFRGLHVDAQYIWDSTLVSLIAGGGLLDSSVGQKETSEITDLASPTPLVSMGEHDEDSSKAFLYTTWHLTDWLDMNLGMNYTHLKLGLNGPIPPFTIGDRKEIEWNPKAGATLYVSPETTIRTAYFETLANAGDLAFEIAEPTLVGGFNQLFDERAGSSARNVGVGIDHQFSKKTYCGIQGLHRAVSRQRPSVETVFDTDLQTNVVSQAFVSSLATADADEDIVKAYFYQVLNRSVTATLDYTLSRFATDFSNPEMPAIPVEVAKTHRVRLGLNYFHPSGLYVFGSSRWYLQDLDGFLDPEQSGSRDFWILGTGVGYEFNKRHGTIELGLNNLLDRNFLFQPTDLESRFLPEFSAGLGVHLSY